MSSETQRDGRVRGRGRAGGIGREREGLRVRDVGRERRERENEVGKRVGERGRGGR